MCDINPDRIHVTVPTARRVRRSGGDLYVIHHQDLAAEQIGWWQQVPTATLVTAMPDDEQQPRDAGALAQLWRRQVLNPASHYDL